jgi:Protein of unknown function (DUF4238)
MAPKSRQHILPVSYQKAFCDATPPEGHRPDTPFEPGVWIIDKDLNGAPYRKAPNNVLVERRFYTLRTDNPAEPVIEEWLSTTETKYARVLRKLLSAAELSPDEWRDLLMFVGVLHARTQSQVSLWQRQFGELEGLTRMVERAHTDREDFSDAQFVDWDEIGKRSIRDRAESFAKIMSQGAVYIVENRTKIPFITSDTPTALGHVFPDELRSWHVPELLLRKDVDRSTQGFVCCCAISPTHAIFASHALGVPGELRWHPTSNGALIASLVWFLIRSADSVLLAHKPKPFPEVVVEAFRQSLERANAKDEIKTYVRLISPKGRVTIEASDVREELEEPLGILRFRTSDRDQLQAAASIGSFVECEYRIDGGAQSGMMRNVHFQKVAATDSEDSVLRQQL